MNSTVNNRAKAHWMMIDGAFIHEGADRAVAGVGQAGAARRHEGVPAPGQRRNESQQAGRGMAGLAQGRDQGVLPPSYSPELNPGERLNADLKHAISRKVPVRTKVKLQAVASEHMQRLQTDQGRVISCHQDSIVKHAV